MGRAAANLCLVRAARAPAQTSRGSDRVAPRGEGLPEGRALQLALEAPTERPVRALQGPSADEQARDVVAAKDTVLPAAQPSRERSWIVRGLRGAWSDALEQVAQLRPDRLDVAERDAGGDQGHELAIGAAGVAVDE